MSFFGNLAGAAPYLAPVLEQKRLRDRQTSQDAVQAQVQKDTAARQQAAEARAAAMNTANIDHLKAETNHLNQPPAKSPGRLISQDGTLYMVYDDGTYEPAKPRDQATPAVTVPSSPSPQKLFDMSPDAITGALRGSMGLKSIDQQAPTQQAAPQAPQQPTQQAATPKFGKPNADPLKVTVGPGGQRTYTPSSKAAGQTAPGPAPTAKQPKYGAFINPKEPGTPPVYITQDDAAARGLIPAPTGTGAASIKTKIATNKTEIATITDALAELDKHPEAVGINRSLGDWLNQRTDPGGVAARASLANIGSLKLHDRSGAAVTAAESPRLMPFIPSIKDNVDVARTKLRKLAEQITIETQLLEQSGGGGAGTGGGRGGPPPNAAASATPSAGGTHTVTINGKTYRVPD